MTAKRPATAIGSVLACVLLLGGGARATAHGGDPVASVEAARKTPSTAAQTVGLPDPELARLRVKNFLRLSHRHHQSLAPEAAGQAELPQILAGVDALTAAQVVAIDGHLQPAMAAARSLDAWAGRVAAADQGDAPAVDEAAAEQLRTEILAYLDRFGPFVGRVELRYPQYGDLLGRLRGRIQGAKVAELSVMLEALDQVPSARAVLSIDPARYVGGAGGGAAALTDQDAAGGARPQRLDAGSIHTLSACNDMAFGPVATTVLNALARTALDVASLLSDDYMASNFNIPEPANIIARTIALPLELVAMAATADLTYFVNCNEGAHQVLFDEHVAESTERMAAILSLIDDSSKLTDIRRTIANRADRMDAFAVEYRKLSLRLAIEQDLLRHGDPRIALFQVPNSICVTVGEHASCGQLDTVRDIVAGTIFDNRAAGFNVSLANVALLDGDTQRSLGLYKAAYTRYRYAYQLAVRSE